MTEHTIMPATLMPKWWRVCATALLYAAYLLWFVPVAMYFWGGATMLTAFAWFAGVVVVQFILVKLIALVEYLSTANTIERLRAEEDDRAEFGDKQ